MEVVIVESPERAGVLVADAIAARLAGTDHTNLGLATGSSPLPVYDELVRRHRDDGLSFVTCTCFLLDEYAGLGPDDPRSYASTIRAAFTGLVDVAPGRVLGPVGDAGDPIHEARRYDQLIATEGGIDLQLLGIGRDGHIGFNEPGSSLASRTRLTTLTRQTRLDNARFFGSVDQVPPHVLTQGVGTILEARHLVLMAFGATKAEPVARAVEGPVTAMCPASALQLHPHATVIIDDDASAGLSLADYYRETFAAKPPEQGL